ncbi:hypothetical protein TNIN_62411 [Trichonephila inaurata madagascariensis]|uniref:Uncharacterized protein n=1 Tax=Trichonephila inaurata madagascariensis TaxID=2747483 RepID=A0A8X6MBF2_9ARAC|nr:hypothetical protein TNIN_62411 [Trichonephila inaurata madagascariensis]
MYAIAFQNPSHAVDRNYDLIHDTSVYFYCGIRKGLCNNYLPKQKTRKMNGATASSLLPKSYSCCKYREVRKRVSMQSVEVWGASPTGASASADHGDSSKYSSGSLED